jgi:hypothetical protein
MSSMKPCARTRWRPEMRPVRIGLALLLALCGLAGGAPARADERVIVQGLADMEGWNSSESLLLGRNEGEPSGLARSRLWASASFTEGLQGFAMGSLSGGSADAEEGSQAYLEQAWVQYSFAPARRLQIRGGKLLQPIGGFSSHYLSTNNPLVGSPLNYSVAYPVGVQVSGAAGRFDYLAAMADKPMPRGSGGGNVYGGEDEPMSALRPMVSVGFRPMIGLRIGLYATRGTWVTRQLKEQNLPPDIHWRDLEQRVHGLDVSFSRGHVEVLAEITRSSTDVPGDQVADGAVYVIEPKVTLSPRWFAAMRLETARLAQAIPYGMYWAGGTQTVKDLEAGFGFRVDPRLLVKASWRVAHSEEYHIYPRSTDSLVAVQLSYSFDVNDWVERRQ